MTLSIFSCSFKPSVRLLWTNVYLDLLPIFWLGCLFFWYWAVWAIYIFWRLVPCWLLSLQIFSHCQGCLFILFVVFFNVRKLLIKPHLFIFIFTPIILGDGSKNILLWFVSKCVLPMFSSESFIQVSGLVFGSSAHFELILCMILQNFLA